MEMEPSRQPRCGRTEAYKHIRRQNQVDLALRELGRIERTLFMLDGLESLELRRGCHAGLSKSEQRHFLAQVICTFKQGRQTRPGNQDRIADAVPRCQQFVPPASTSSSPRSCSGTRPTSPTAMYGRAMHQAPIVQSHGDGRWRCGFGGGSAEVFFSMSFIIWISILVARELAPAVSLTSASRLGILRRGPFVVTNTGSFSADQKPRKVLLGPTAGSWRDRCSRSAGHSGHPRLHRAVAGVDRQLAKAEFHLYIRGRYYC